jgi:hypothetical protein
MINLPVPGRREQTQMAFDDAGLNLLREIEAKVSDVRERLVRLEAQGYHERLNKIEDGHDSLRDRTTILETQGRFFTAGVSAGVALIVSFAGSIFSYFIGK